MSDFDLFPPHFSTDSGWKTALKPFFSSSAYQQLAAFVTSQRAQFQVFPNEETVFSAYQFTPLHAVKVVIVGQDPYPTPGHACGLAFGVAPGVSPPASLKNIYQELLRDGELKHLPATGNLESWAQQGVLLLNTCLTVQSGAPGSHSGRGWEALTTLTLETINALPNRVVFLLWGNHAQQFAPIIQAPHVVLMAAHPSPLSAYRGFKGCGHFSKANQFLQEAGRTPIRWDDIR
jgi:uracil-DNA glycosylase